MTRAVKHVTKAANCVHDWRDHDDRYVICRICGTPKAREDVAMREAEPQPMEHPEAIPDRLAAIHVAVGLPGDTTRCETCELVKWARPPQHPGYVVCSFCHPPKSWDTLRLPSVPYTPPKPAKEPAFLRSKTRPDRACGHGHRAWIQGFPSFPNTWFCEYCIPGKVTLKNGKYEHRYIVLAGDRQNKHEAIVTETLEGHSA